MRYVSIPVRSLVLAPALLLGCSVAFPARLAGTVHRLEEQGIDYSGMHTSAFVLALSGDGTGRAVRTTHAVDVFEADARETNETVRFAAVARWEGQILVITLEQRAKQRPEAFLRPALRGPAVSHVEPDARCA